MLDRTIPAFFLKKDGPQRKLRQFTYYGRFSNASGTRFSRPGGTPDVEDGGRRTVREVRIGSGRNQPHIISQLTQLGSAGTEPAK